MLSLSQRIMLITPCHRFYLACWPVCTVSVCFIAAHSHTRLNYVTHGLLFRFSVNNENIFTQMPQALPIFWNRCKWICSVAVPQSDKPLPTVGHFGHLPWLLLLWPQSPYSQPSSSPEIVSWKDHGVLKEAGSFMMCCVCCQNSTAVFLLWLCDI